MKTMVIKTLYKMFKQVPVSKIFWAPPELICGLPNSSSDFEIHSEESAITLTIPDSECYMKILTKYELFNEVLSAVPEDERKRLLIELATFYYIRVDGKKTPPYRIGEIISLISKETVDLMEEHSISAKLLEQLRKADAVIPITLANLCGNLVYQLYVEYDNSIKLFTGVRSAGFVKTFDKSFIGGHLKFSGFPRVRSKSTIPRRYDKPLVFNALLGLIFDKRTCISLINRFDNEFVGDYFKNIPPAAVVLALSRALNYPQFLDELLAGSLEKLEKGIPFNENDHIALNKFLEIANYILEPTELSTYKADSLPILDTVLELTASNFLSSRFRLYRGNELPLSELSKIEPPRGFYWISKKTKSGRIKHLLSSFNLSEPFITSLGKEVYILFPTPKVTSGYKLRAKDLLKIKEEILSFYYNFENKEV